MAIQIKKSTLKKNKKAAPNGVAHIQSTFNNTIVTITNVNGEKLLPKKLAKKLLFKELKKQKS